MQIQDILGDSYLQDKNPIYRNIKEQAVHIGCQFVEAWQQYLLLPFYELDKIVETKRIPYVPHGRLLRELEAKRPGVFSIDDLPMPESYHMHEAAHVIAENLFTRVICRTDQEKILKIILCESFANTVDALACVFADDEEHQHYLKLNCYMSPDQEDMDVLKRFMGENGFEQTFDSVFFAYAHANFFRDNPAINQSEERAAIAQMSEKLDQQFRFQTTGIYLKMAGFDDDIMDTLNFPFMSIYEKNKDFQQVVEKMGKILLPSSYEPGKV